MVALLLRNSSAAGAKLRTLCDTAWTTLRDAVMSDSRPADCLSRRLSEPSQTTAATRLPAEAWYVEDQTWARNTSPLRLQAGGAQHNRQDAKVA